MITWSESYLCWCSHVDHFPLRNRVRKLLWLQKHFLRKTLTLNLYIFVFCSYNSNIWPLACALLNITATFQALALFGSNEFKMLNVCCLFVICLWSFKAVDIIPTKFYSALSGNRLTTICNPHPHYEHRVITNNVHLLYLVGMYIIGYRIVLWHILISMKYAVQYNMLNKIYTLTMTM